MAEDLYGRNPVEYVTATDFSHALFGPTSKVVETKSPGTEERLERLYDAVNALARFFDPAAAQDLRGSKHFAQQVVGMTGQIQGRGDTPGRRTKLNSAEMITYLKTTSETMERLYHAATSKNTIWVGVAHFTSEATGALKRILVDCGLCGRPEVIKEVSAAGEKGAAAEAERGVVTPKTGKIATAGPAAGGGLKAFATQAWGVTKAIGAWLPLINQFAFNVSNIHPMQIIPSMTDLNNTREEIRRIIYLSRGFGDTNREMEKTYRDVKNEANAAGTTVEQFYKIWTQNLQRGTVQFTEQEKLHGDSLALLTEQEQSLKGAQKQVMIRNKLEDLRIRRAKALTMTATHTATQLGLDAGAINDIFFDWHIQLGLSDTALGRVSAKMMEIARSTGLSGAKLQEAVKASDQLAKHLFDTGSFSESTMKNVMAMSASMSKYGQGDLYNMLMKGTSSIEEFSKMDSKYQAALMRGVSMARERGVDVDMTSLWSGEMASNPKLFQEVWDKGVAAFAKQTIGNILGKDPEEINLTKLNELMLTLPRQQKAVIENVLRNMGFTVGQLQATSNAVEENSKNTQQKMEAINEELESLKSAFGEKTAKKMPAYLEALRRQEELASAAQFDALGQYMEAQKKIQIQGEGSRAAIEAELEKNLKGEMGEGLGRKTMTALRGGTLPDDLFGNLASRAKKAGMNFEKDYGKITGLSVGDTKKALEKARQTGKGGEDVIRQMQRFTQELEKREKVGQDPATKARDDLLEAHNKLAVAADACAEAIAGLTAALWPLMAVASGWTVFKVLKSALGRLAGWLGGMKGGGIGRGLTRFFERTLPRFLGRMVGGLWRSLGRLGIGRLFSGLFRGLGRILGATWKKLPIIGLIYGVIMGAWKLLQGKFGEALSLFVSGIVSLIPGIGTALAFVIDIFSETIGKWVDSFTTWLGEGMYWLGSTIWGWATKGWDYVSSAWNSLTSTVSSWAGTAWDGIVSAWNSLTSTVSSWAGTAWDGIVSAWNSLTSTVSSWAGTAWDGIVSAWNSLTSTVSSWAGTAWDGVVSVWNSLTGTITGWASSAWDGISSIWTGFTGTISGWVNSAIDGLRNLLPSWLSSWVLPQEEVAPATAASGVDIPKLAEGSSKIIEGGVAKLHEGEMVLPKEMSEVARGEKTSTLNRIAQVMLDSPMAALIPGLPLLQSQVGTTQAPDKNNMVAELSRVVSFMPGMAPLMNAMGIVRPNSMDYSDETKGVVSTATTSATQREEAIEQKKYGDAVASSSSVNMSEVSDYLNKIQASKLDTMISVLKSIDAKLNPVNSSPQTIQASEMFSKSATRPGVKNIALDLVTGAWDLLATSYSPTAVTTDGRGGS